MLVTDLLRKVVVFIGHSGVRGDFIADGTGFLLHLQAYGFAFPYVVTAKHVIDQATGELRDRPVLLRLNLKAGDIEYLTTKPEQWQTHPDHVEEGRRRRYIDVAVYSILNYKNWARTDINKYDFTYLMEEDLCTDEVMQKYMIGLGDEVVIPGLFLSHLGATQNVPVVRTGNIAAMRGEAVPTSRGPMDAYLVEMRSVGGISGSPVLTHMAVRPKVMLPESDLRAEIKEAPKTHYLLGLMHGHYTITTQEEWVFKTDQMVGDINAGIAIVVPASKIMETIQASAFFAEDYELARRYREFEGSKAKSVEDSAPSGAAGAMADDANPLHLEDFKRLVDAAARKRQQDDQT